jgi:hypothetical protein
MRKNLWCNRANGYIVNIGKINKETGFSQGIAFGAGIEYKAFRMEVFGYVHASIPVHTEVFEKDGR